MFALRPWKKTEMVDYAPFRLRNEFKVLFDRMFRGMPVMFEAFTEPNYFRDLEVKETEKDVVVRVEVPGFEAAELEVELRDNCLHIKAERKPEAEKKEKDYEYTERPYERYVELPVETDPAKVEAIYRNGVLEVRLPKAEAAIARRISVK